MMSVLEYAKDVAVDVKTILELCKKLDIKANGEDDILDDDISDEFIEIKGDVFGDKYKKTYTCVQIKVAESIASELESKLNDKGIEAKNIAVGRVNIRTK